jgi:hypothetical protein
MTHRRSRAKASTLVREPLPSSLSRRLPALVPPEHRRSAISRPAPLRSTLPVKAGPENPQRLLRDPAVWCLGRLLV